MVCIAHGCSLLEANRCNMRYWYKFLCAIGRHAWCADSSEIVQIPGTTDFLAQCKCLRCPVERVRKI
jgi:hypothetical protein